MSRVCILTDSTAQFTQPHFPGRDQVTILPSSLQLASQQETTSLAQGRMGPQLVPPSVQDFVQCYQGLCQSWDAILVLTISAALSPLMGLALSASRQYGNHAEVEVVDSQTTAVGLGLLVQTAARLLEQGANLREVVHHVRVVIPHIYLLFCIPELTYLARAGYLAYSQALVGEMMGMLPVFTLEEGRLTPLEKVRTPRHLFESFQEFINEFEQPEHVALLGGVNQTTLRTRPLRQFVQEAFPKTSFSEHTIHSHLAALLGPQSIGLVVKDRLDERQ